MVTRSWLGRPGRVTEWDPSRHTSDMWSKSTATKVQPLRFSSRGRDFLTNSGGATLAAEMEPPRFEKQAGHQIILEDSSAAQSCTCASQDSNRPARFKSQNFESQNFESDFRFKHSVIIKCQIVRIGQVQAARLDPCTHARGEVGGWGGACINT